MDNQERNFDVKCQVSSYGSEKKINLSAHICDGSHTLKNDNKLSDKLYN